MHTQNMKQLKDNTCTRCGKCCMHMRRYMIIERSVGDSQYYCNFSLTKERFLARIGGQDLDLFRDSRIKEQYPDACPFLRVTPDRFHCTIYASRPSHCKNFMCDKKKPD